MVPIHKSRFVAFLQLLRTRCRDPLASELSYDSVNFVSLESCLELDRLVPEAFRFFGDPGGLPGAIAHVFWSP